MADEEYTPIDWDEIFKDPPTIMKPFYKVRWFVKETLPFGFRNWRQKIFRRDHICDFEVWEFQYHAIKYIYPRLKKFWEMEKNGIPTTFIDEPRTIGMTQERYDELIASGELVGGGEEKWNELLGKMTMAFEFNYKDYTFEYDRKKQFSDFCKRWGYDYEALKGGDYSSKAWKDLFADVDEGFRLFGVYLRAMWD